MKFFWFLLLSLTILTTKISAQQLNFQLTQNEWLEDVEYLKKQVEKTVPIYQMAERRKAFDSIYNIIMDNDIGHLKEDKIFALERLLNTLEDEGCSLSLFQSGLDLNLLPIKTYWFENGLYILDAANQYASFVGKQIIRINQLPIKEVFNRLKPIINADNDHYKKYLFQAYGFMPLALKALGLGESDSTIELQFADGENATFTAEGIVDYGKLSRRLPNDSEFQYTGTSHKGENYWMEFLPDTKTLFVQLKRIANTEDGPTFSSFVDDIENEIISANADQIILDVRYGGGGNGFKLKKLTDLLRQSSINENGKLFVLTSRATRGTLLELTSILKYNTKAILIGQPTAEGPNTVGDIKSIKLPNSGLSVFLTHTLWPTSWEQDKRTYLVPDITSTYKFLDYKSKKDPWVEAVLHFENTRKSTSVPKDLQKQLQGTYSLNGRKISIKSKEGRLFLTMNRKMKSFFEIHTELYLKSDGVLSSDIEEVNLKYNTANFNIEHLDWNGIQLQISRK